MRSRLFCRQSDPHALLAGLHSVESCSTRLCAVVQSLTGILGSDAPLEGDSGRSPAVESVERGLADVRAAMAELAACACSIEAAVHHRVPAAAREDLRWSSELQEHYPELLAVEVPPPTEPPPRAGVDEFTSVVNRCRLQITAVKDRYSMVLPGLPWLGPERDEFTGRRLTTVRLGLESAVRALDTALPPEPEVDLTDETNRASVA